jgi:hypothetical protein
MKLMAFHEIADLENGQQIPALTGRVKRVFDQLTGVGQYGQWWLQSFILTDERGTELRCTWSGEDTVNNLEGKEIFIESGRDKKDQLVGIKKEIKNKNGKHYETVKIDDRCKIKPTNGGDATCPAKVQQEETTQRRSSNAAPTSEPESAANGITEARQHLCQAANLYNLCVKAVDAMIAPELPEIAQTSEQFQAAVASLFIEGSRA